MKFRAVLLGCLLILLALISCSGDAEKLPVVVEPSTEPPEVLHSIRITAEDTELFGVLYDNSYARDFSHSLPMTVYLWVPADFAKAFSLAGSLGGYEHLIRQYVPGGIAYWPQGPAVAIFHSPDEPRTAVPIAYIGQIEEGEEFFAEYTRSITIERYDEP